MDTSLLITAYWLYSTNTFTLNLELALLFNNPLELVLGACFCVCDCVCMLAVVGQQKERSQW